jgi:predicted lipoprotein with Yx(FWY)xxD motif
MKWVQAITIAVSGLALGAVAACGQSAAVPGNAAVEQQAGAQQDDGYGDAPQAQNQTAAQASKLGVASAGTLGTVVVNDKGFTVYRFDKDKKEPPTTNCDGDCAQAWPPVMVTDPAAVQVDGIDKALLGTVTRPDGSKQLTIGGWPGYTYAKDTKPGDVNGQGVGGTWFAFTPDGKKAAAKNAATVTIAVMPVKPLGDVLTDAQGMTLYRFDKDGKNPAKSACEGNCAEKWPPLLMPDGAKLDLKGVDPSVVGTTLRADGSKQVTVGGWALYTFAGDKKPCDTNGQGVGGTWFASTATGGKAGV